ncbi:MAG: hypothetical protein ACI959_000873 [Limisphaerales bacterium]|jgi:hypothetical protein
MKRSTALYIIGGVLMALILIFWMGNLANKKNWDWFQMYSLESEQPYGLKVFRNTLEGSREVVIFEDGFANLDSISSPANYFATGSNLYLDSADVEGLFQFVRAGNVAFISSRVYQDTLLYELNAHYLDDYTFQSTRIKSAQFNFLEPPVRMKEPHTLYRKHKSDKIPYQFKYIDTIELNWTMTSAKVHGVIEGIGANLISVDYGEGRFYFMTSPIAFTNYFMIQPDGRDYVERMLSHLNDGPIYWDNRIWGDNSNAESRAPGVSPLRYIISQPSLRWAWYIILGGVGLYLLFRTKRRQAPIPLIDPRENTSLEYVYTISGLYYTERKDHRPIAEMLIQQFFAFIRERYHMSTSRVDDRFIKSLIAQSGAGEKVVEKLIKHIEYLDTNKTVSDYELLRLHRHIQEFYAHPDVLPKGLLSENDELQNDSEKQSLNVR